MHRNSFRIVFLLLAALGGTLFAARSSGADLEWTETGRLTLDAAPRDIVTSPDGKWIFVLTKGELAVYAPPAAAPAGRLPVDDAFDRLSYNAQDETVILSSTGSTVVRFLRPETVHTFALQGVPFRGPANAPVVLTVFSDYQ